MEFYMSPYEPGLLTLGRRLWLRHKARVNTVKRAFDEVRKKSPVDICNEMNWQFHLCFEAAQIIREELGMAKKTVREPWMTNWVKVEMTEDLKKQFKAWDVEDRDVWDGLDGWAAQGYSINMMFDASAKTYQVNIIGKAADCMNEGSGVSAYAGDSYTAYKLALFKVHMVLPNKWSDYESGDKDKLG